MATYTNFYETLSEALMRLRATIILYDGRPYLVWTITDNPDGIFRIYMSEITKVNQMPENLPCGHSIPHGHVAMAEAMHNWMSQYPDYIIRKQMNSPLFNRFRPFPLGMLNQDCHAIYTVRQPVRPKTEQGLTLQMLYTKKVAPSNTENFTHVDMYSEGFYDCIMGNYPSPKVALEGVTSTKFENQSVGFHREFALVRGPLDLVFLAYKDEIIGVLPRGDFTEVMIGRKFLHTKEAVDDLNLFYDIRVKR